MAQKNTGTSIIVRRATHADCGAINSIDSVTHAGFDKILCCIHPDVVSDHKFPFLAEVDGEVVGYICGHVIDDGYVLVSREARLKEGHKRNNIVGRMDRGLIVAAKKKFPKLKHMVWSSRNIQATEQALARHPNMRLALRRNGLMISTPMSILKTILSSDVFRDLGEKFLTDNVLSHSKEEALKLLTGEIPSLSYSPARPTISWQPSGWHSATVAEQLRITDLFTSRCPNSGTINAYSFLTTTGTDHGIRTDIEVYCDENSVNDFSLVVGHILNALRVISVFSNDPNVISLVNFPLKSDIDSIIKILTENLRLPIRPEVKTISHQLEYRIDHAFGRKGKL